MASPKSDLYVITKAKELAKYVVVVTEKSPKKYRFTLVDWETLIPSRSYYSFQNKCSVGGQGVGTGVHGG